MACILPRRAPLCTLSQGDFMDRYTKIVLTVIAVALTVLAAENGIKSANAQAGVQKVAICDQTGGNCALVMAQRLYISEH